MAEITLREVVDRDVEGLVALWRACGLTRPWNDPHQDIAFARQSANATILVAEDVDGIAASVMVGHDGHRGWVYYVASSPEQRELGLGRRMMEAAETWLRERGLWKMQLMVREDNEQAVTFYEHLGFRRIPTVLLQKEIAGEATKERG